MTHLTIEINIADSPYNYDAGKAEMTCNLDSSVIRVLETEGGLYLGNLVEMLLRTAYADYKLKHQEEESE